LRLRLASKYVFARFVRAEQTLYIRRAPNATAK
jgi:hypothetical protein